MDSSRQRGIFRIRRIGLFALVAACIGAAGYELRQTFGAAGLSNDPLFIDAATNRPFHFHLISGMTTPVPAPSGQRSGYPAELCYWTAAGTLRQEPFPVLLNHYRHLPEPTFCPDCGRLIRPQSPPPSPGDAPPPTQAEYRASPDRWSDP